MTKMKIGLWISLAVGLAALAGWLYGWSGTASLRQEVATTSLRLHLVEARMKALDARVDIYTTNFGNASRNLEYIKAPLQQARARLAGADRRDELTAKLDAALQHAAEAQQLASKFSQDANGRAGEVSRLIDEVIQATQATQATR